ncbi:hypothetical protein OH779_29485 [Actinacidiphila glaucinigra]|uniref:hypothetical protein n=1 Tax=Actinacidiphila glaucinigra TaxID=235986 RepID=UPI00386A7A7C
MPQTSGIRPWLSWVFAPEIPMTSKTDDLKAFVQAQRDARAAQPSKIKRREQAAAARTAAEQREARAIRP